MFTRVNSKDIKDIIAATFPDFKGRKVSISSRGKVTFVDLNWSGGRRSEYVACTIEGKPLASMAKHNATAPWLNKAEGATIDIPDGALVVELAREGSKQFLYLHANPANMPKLLEVK